MRPSRWLFALCLLLAACDAAPRPPAGTAFVLPQAGPSAPTSPVASQPVPSASPTPGPSATPLPDGVTTLAGGESPGFADGLGAAARFEGPRAVVAAEDGTIYVADTENHRIRRVSAGGQVTTIAGGEPGFQDGPGATARFDQPVGLALGPGGVLYVADSQNGRIRMLAFDGAGQATVTTIAGNDSRDSLDGDGTAAAFNVPYGLAADPAGRLFLTDRLAQVVRRIEDPQGRATVTTLAGAVDTLGDADGPAARARFAFPTGIAIDHGGTLYLSEEDGCRIRRIAPDGQVTTLNPTANGCGFADGPLPDAQFLGPAGLAIDRAGVLYLADADNGLIRRLDLAGGEAKTLAGELPGFEDGPLLEAAFQAPRGLAFGADGRLVVADAHGIRLVNF